MNPLEMLKKGISALNPIPKKVDVPAPKKDNPVMKSVTEEKGTMGKGYLGDSARKVNKRNKALQDAAEGL